MFQRLDILDFKGKWLEANIVSITTDALGNQTHIKVHFRGFTAIWEETIDLKAESLTRVKEVGALSSGFGWAKTNQVYQERLMLEMERLGTIAEDMKQKLKA